MADAVNAKAGSDITKAEVSMPHGVIRELGDYQISLELGYDVKATISVSVVGLESTAGVSADGSLIEEIDEAEAANASESDDSEESSDSSKEEKLAE